MVQAMQEFLTVFRPLAERVRANAPDDAVRPYVRPMQNAIRTLPSAERDEAFRMMAELAISAPLPAVGLASLLCGVFVENSGTVSVGAPAIIAAGRRAFATAARQREAIWAAWRAAEGTKGGRLSPQEAQAASEKASRVFSAEERGTLAKLPFFSDPLCAIMERSKQVRKTVREDRAFCQDIWAFREQGNDTPALLSKLLIVLDDVDLLVLHPQMRRGYSVRIAGICHNFQLHTLLADALIGDPAQGLLPGPRPDPRAVGMAKDQPFDPEAPPAQASFHLQTWHAIRPDGSHDTGAMNHVLWHEGTPADIPAVEGLRIVVLSPVTLPRSWRAPRDWTEMVGELEIRQKLSPEQVNNILNMLAARPRDEEGNTDGRNAEGRLED
jgi:hypothetical protein